MIGKKRIKARAVKRPLHGAGGRLFTRIATPIVDNTLRAACAVKDAIKNARTRRKVSKAFTPLELAPYNFSGAVNNTSTSIPDGVKALMKEIGAKEASIYLKRDGEAGLAHYLTTDGNNVDPRGGVPSPMIKEAFERQHMQICIPRKKGSWPPSRMFTATMVPNDIKFLSEKTWRCQEYYCAVPLTIRETGENGRVESKRLGVLTLRGDERRVKRSSLAGKETIEKVGVFIAGASRILSKIIHDRFDLLTGLPKRPELAGQLNQMKGNFSMLMIDIDHFKRINDNPKYGHDVGDIVLRRFAQIINTSIRSNVETRRDDNVVDLLFRYGGEEFVILLPNLDSKKSIGIAERLRAKVESTPIDIGGEEIHITCSIGVVDAKTAKGNGGRPPEKHLGEIMITIADRAMFSAKDNGRNGVVTAKRVDDEIFYTECHPN